MTVNEPIDIDKPHTKTLANGAIYDLDKGRIVANPGGGIKAFTSDSASEAVKVRIDKKRARVIAGANAAVRDKLPDKFDGIDDDYIEAIAQQVAIKALDRLDPKQVDAARFVFGESGVAEPKQVEQSGARIAVTLGTDALQAVLMALAGDTYTKPKLADSDIIDAIDE